LFQYFFDFEKKLDFENVEKIFLSNKIYIFDFIFFLKDLPF